MFLGICSYNIYGKLYTEHKASKFPYCIDLLLVVIEILPPFPTEYMEVYIFSIYNIYIFIDQYSMYI